MKADAEYSPLIVELVGPAGAGKTAVSQTLSQNDRRIVLGPELELRKMEQLSIVLRVALTLLPVLLYSSLEGRRLTWDEIKSMIYLQGWRRVLFRLASNSPVAIILDHGPIFKLAKLLEFGSERFRQGATWNWWSEMLRQWGSTLDVIVWLDAKDSTLIDRINTRDQRHAVKDSSKRDASAFLARYRSAYEQILSKVSEQGHATLYRIDTTDVSIEHIAAEVSNACIYSYQ